MNKILIIPDIHGRQFWKEATEKHMEECDKVIFLGDYVDSYQQENITKKEAIDNFQEIIDYKLENKDKVVLLIGNHCAHYFLKNFPRSTRYDSSNAYNIREMYLSHLSLFNISHEEEINGKKYLFTHAGVMKSWLDRNKDIIGELTSHNLNQLIKNDRGINALGEISKYRTYIGYDSGSPLWSDVREKIDLDNSDESNIIPNDDSIINEYDYQIFGHTQLPKNPIITDKWACLDCRKAFIINEQGEIIEA